MFCYYLDGRVGVVVEFFNIFFQIPYSILHTLGLLIKLFGNYFLLLKYNNKT